MITEPIAIIFSETDYEITKMGAYYKKEMPPVFYLDVTVKVADEIFPKPIQLDFPFETALELVERVNPGMVKYIKSTVNMFQGQDQAELSAIKTLCDETFDIKQFYIATLSQVRLDFEPTYDEMP
jgi:hypothetical protein